MNGTEKQVRLLYTLEQKDQYFPDTDKQVYRVKIVHTKLAEALTEPQGCPFASFSNFLHFEIGTAGQLGA